MPVHLLGVTYFDGEYEGVRRPLGESDNVVVGAWHALFLCPFMAFPHVLQILGLPLTDAAAATFAAAGFAGDSVAAARAARKDVMSRSYCSTACERLSEHNDKHVGLRFAVIGCKIKRSHSSHAIVSSGSSSSQSNVFAGRAFFKSDAKPWY